jgi:hypothetical protein
VMEWSRPGRAGSCSGRPWDRWMIMSSTAGAKDLLTTL